MLLAGLSYKFFASYFLSYVKRTLYITVFKKVHFLFTAVLGLPAYNFSLLDSCRLMYKHEA
jgi:hypothetical protein